MIRTAFAAASLLLAIPAAAQSQQEALDARYDRALAAGYKALMLCSAIAHAEANGASRTPESVHEWELAGIQSPLDAVVRNLPYDIVRRPTGQVAEVQVGWAEDMPARIAVNYGTATGCSALPIGAPEGISNPSEPIEMPEAGKAEARTVVGTVRSSGTAKASEPQPRPLDKVLKAATEGGYGTGRTTVVLVRAGEGTYLDGRSLKQAVRSVPGFSQNTPQRTWSVAKSLAATLVGMAVHSNEFSVSDPVRVRDWLGGGEFDTRNTITIDHALRMASGRYSDTPGNRTDPIYWGGSTVDEYMTKWPAIRPPGTVFRYANNDTLLAARAIRTYLDFYTLPTLLAKIGMTRTVVETDWNGGHVLSSQVWATASDLANLGQLYLQNGVWKGERLLPEDWRDYVSDPRGPQPEGSEWGYGAGWWTFRRPEGNAFEGVPDDAFAARGNRGQYVVVVPSRNVVIVRRGEDMVGTRFDIAAFTRDVLAALEQ